MSNELAPNPGYPERVGTVYEAKIAPAIPGNRGPLRFEEGVGTDTDVPSDFTLGAMQGYITAPGRPNHNANVYEKYPEETMRQRAHVGSAAWVEGPQYLNEFAHGANTEVAALVYEQVGRSGGHYARRSPAVVTD